jgi:hypothetical protein
MRLVLSGGSANLHCAHAGSHQTFQPGTVWQINWASWSRVNLLVGNAESIPAPNASFDLVTGIFMFHELPPKFAATLLANAPE